MVPPFGTTITHNPYNYQQKESPFEARKQCLRAFLRRLVHCHRDLLARAKLLKPT